MAQNPRISKRDGEHDGRAPRGDDQRRALAEAVLYLRSRRIEVPEDESAGGVVRLFAAIKRFERAVSDRGGVLMIAGVPSRRTAKTRFMLPSRRDDETIGGFAARVRSLAKRIAGTAA